MDEFINRKDFEARSGDAGPPASPRCALGLLTVSMVVGACSGGADTAREAEPQPAPPLVIETFSASSRSVAPSERVSLNWRAPAAESTSLAAEPGGPIITEGPTAGSLLSSPIFETTTFRLTARRGDEVAEATVRVDVGSSLPDAPKVLELAVAPNPVGFGERVVVVWRTLGADRIQLFENDRALYVSNEQLEVGSFEWIADRAQLRFFIEAYAGDQRAVDSVVVDVELPEPLAVIRPTDGRRTTVQGRLAPHETAVIRVLADGPGTLVAEAGSPAIGRCDEVVRLSVANPQRTTLGTTKTIVAPSGEAYECGRIDPDRTDDLSLLTDPGPNLILVISDAEEEVPFEVTARLYDNGCGNGYVDPGELCDDGDRNPAGRCNSNCTPNVLDPRGLTANFEVGTRFDPFRRIRIRVPSTGQSLTASVAAPAGGPCGTNTMTGLLPPSGSYAIGHGPRSPGCGGIMQPVDAYAADLTPGLYDVFVLHPGVDSGGGGGDVSVRLDMLSSRCGNAITETSAGEDCDDANMVSGDGCTSSCGFDSSIQREIEPNQTAGEATLVSVDPAGAWTTIAASLKPSSDFDRFAFDVPEGAGIEVRTYDLLGDAAVCNAPDTFIRIFNPLGPIAENDDIGPPRPSLCSHLFVPGPLPAGRYGVSVQEVDPSVQRNRYFVDVRLRF